MHQMYQTSEKEDNSEGDDVKVVKVMTAVVKFYSWKALRL